MSARDGRTEKATPQRKKKARDEGQVPRSQEVAVATSILALVATCAVAGRPAVEAGMDAFRTAFLSAGNPDAIAASAGTASQLGVAMAAPFLAITTAAALVSGAAQVGIRINPKLAKPKLKNLDPKKGLEKLKPSVAGWELIRSTAKVGAVTVVTWPTLSTWREHLGTDRTLAGGMDRLAGAYGTILLRAAVLAAAIAVADFLYQRHRVDKQTRMSKDDIKREYKDSEGDPQLRSARKRRASELSRNRMLRDASSADVLLVNPTHIAIALRYDPEDGAPRVLAKGADRIADKLRTIAGRHGIPIQADVPLARTLYRTVRVGQHVPAALYEAVAVVLAVAYRRSGRGPASRPLDGPGTVRRRTVRTAA